MTDMIKKAPRSTFLGARVTTDTYVQLKTLSKATGQPISKVASDILEEALLTKTRSKTTNATHART